MKWLVCSALTLSLLVACEKEIPFENTRPATNTPVTPGGPGPVPLLDAGLVFMDAQVAPDSGAVVEVPTGEFSKTGLLKAFADCSLERYREFNERAATLRAATAAWAANPTDELRAAAQVAWRAAMESWQRAEMFRFGPSGPASMPGGRDLRNGIYFYPDLNNCLVDQQVVSGGYTMRPLTMSLSARGLGALEYLLFHAGPENSCSSAVTINTSPSAGAPTPWQQNDAATLNRKRAEYAAALGEDVGNQAITLLDAWDPAKGNFHAQFSQAGTPGSQTYAQQQDAFNVVDDAMFYWHTELKDYKLAIPMGISVECPTEQCPERVESRFSQATNSNIVQNIIGFRMLYQGCGPNFSGFGFDDYLRAVNKADLADRMQAGVIAAQQSAETLPLPFEQLLSADPGRAMALYSAIKVISDALKTEFVGALNLQQPAAVEGDND